MAYSFMKTGFDMTGSSDPVDPEIALKVASLLSVFMENAIVHSKK